MKKILEKLFDNPNKTKKIQTRIKPPLEELIDYEEKSLLSPLATVFVPACQIQCIKLTQNNLYFTKNLELHMDSWCLDSLQDITKLPNHTEFFYKKSGLSKGLFCKIPNEYIKPHLIPIYDSLKISSDDTRYLFNSLHSELWYLLRMLNISPSQLIVQLNVNMECMPLADLINAIFVRMYPCFIGFFVSFAQRIQNKLKENKNWNELYHLSSIDKYFDLLQRYSL